MTKSSFEQSGNLCGDVNDFKTKEPQHTAGAPEISIDQFGLSRREKLCCPEGKLTGNAGNFYHQRWQLIFAKRDLQFPTPYHIGKSEK